MRLFFVNLITFLGFCCTSASLYFIFNKSNFNLILILLNFSIISDFVDGYLARKFNASSKFGKIFDLVHDFFLYLIIPVSFLSLLSLNPIATFILIILILSGAYRLIRFFNIGTVVKDNQIFWTGMPVIYNLLLIPISLTNLAQSYYFIILLCLISIILMPSKVLFLKLNFKQMTIMLLIFNFMYLTALWL